jgi:hypothetical protein
MSFILTPAPNLLINPFMEIDQANEGSSVSLATGTSSYGVDMWWGVFVSSTASGVTIQRVADAPLGYPNSLKLTVGTGASSIGATDRVLIITAVESYNFAETAFGTSSAQPLALTFWAKSSIASYTFNIVLQNSSSGHSYTANCTIASANTWTKFVVIIPGDTSGTWLLSGTGQGLRLCFTAATGSTYQTTANAWQSGLYYGTSSNTNTILTTSSATFQISAVKLEIGSIATAMARKKISEELALCQRYYEKSWDLGTVTVPNGQGESAFLGYFANANPVGGSIYFKATKRVSPTCTLYSPVTAASGKARDNANGTDVTGNINTTGTSGVSWYASPSAGNQAFLSVHWIADARF